MRCCFLFILLFQLFVYQPLFSQPTGPVHEKDSARKESRKTVVEYIDWQDSVKREALLRQMKQNGKSLDTFLAEMKEQQKKEERRRWIRIGAGAFFLLALFFAIARRSRIRK